MMNLDLLRSHCDLDRGVLSGRPRTERRLADLRGCFLDGAAYDAALAVGNPLVYTVSSIEPAAGEGDLHCGLGVILPGKIGNEYWLTKGHLHAWRLAAECYIGLRGEGAMLLEDERSGESHLVSLCNGDVVNVPGHTAHRTINTGSEPLCYLGVYPARAGHDYGSIAEKNFRSVVVAREGKPTLLERAAVSKQVK